MLNKQPKYLHLSILLSGPKDSGTSYQPSLSSGLNVELLSRCHGPATSDYYYSITDSLPILTSYMYNVHHLSRADIWEDKTNNTIIAEIEVPGIAKADIDISISEGKLIVSTKHETPDRGPVYLMQERAHGESEIKVKLPTGTKVYSPYRTHI